MWYAEILGTVASLIIVSSFISKDIKVIRILNTVGSIMCLIYGILIHSFSNVFLNSLMILIQIYHLIKLRKHP